MTWLTVERLNPDDREIVLSTEEVEADDAETALEIVGYDWAQDPDLARANYHLARVRDDAGTDLGVYDVHVDWEPMITVYEA